MKRWWRARQYRKWERLWLESIGKQEEVLKGKDGIIYRIAYLDQIRAENMMRHYAAQEKDK